MGIAEKINDILEPATTEKNKVKEATSAIELFMNWLFSNYEFRLNALSIRPEYRKIGEDEFKELDDQSFNTISILAEINGFTKTMVDKLNRIILSGYVPKVNEIADFFEQIEPLGRSASFMGDDYEMPTVRQYFECLKINEDIDREMLYGIFARWAIASVNSALGIKHNDVMLILSGPQGLYKTSYLNNLVPNELGKEKYLVCGHIEPSLTNQNTANFLCEKFIINIDDQLEVIFGKEYNSMKAIISVDRVTSRRVYAKFDRTRKRIANFVGSVNSNEFLTDHQNRRYFVLEVNSIDPDYSKVDICKFWAEAYQMAKKVNPYKIYTREVFTQINQLSNHYIESSVEQAIINRYFSPFKTADKDEEIFMTNGELMLELQKFTTKQLGSKRLANELKRAGYVRTFRYLNNIGNSRYGYLLYTNVEHATTLFKEYQTKSEVELIF